MLKKIIIIVCILILIIMVTILFLINDNNSSDQSIEKIQDLSKSQEIVKVQDYSKFYTVKKCIDRYFSLINSNYSLNNILDSKKDINSMKEMKGHILNMLSKDFLDSNHITVDNITDKIQTSNEKVDFIPLKMDMLKDNNIEKYMVYGILENINNKYIKEINFIVNLDIKNNTFSIQPIVYDNENQEVLVLERTNDSIQENEDNKFELISIDDEYISKEYFKVYKKLLMCNLELAYNYLDNSYKQKRFPTIEKYKEYFEDNYNKIKGMNLSKYVVNKYNEYTQYVCVDQYENFYIFNSTAPMEYSLKLDTYTIDSDKFITEYNNGSNMKKVQLNIDKFIKMINNQDYTNSYCVLDEDFKQRYFKTEESFKKYIKNNFFEKNAVSYNEFSQEGDLYICKITLINKIGKVDNTGYTKKLNIIMQLKEGTDFVMSFGKAE